MKAIYLLLITILLLFLIDYASSCVKTSQRCYNHKECCSGYCHRGLCSKRPSKRPTYRPTPGQTPRPPPRPTNGGGNGNGNGEGGSGKGNAGDVLGEIADTGQCILRCVQGIGNGKSQRRMSYYSAQQTNSGNIIQTVYNIGSCVVNIANDAIEKYKL